MSIQAYPKQYSQVACGPNTDKVMFAIPLPPGAVVNQVTGYVKMITTVGISRLTGCAYGFHGYILPVLDPDSGQTPELIWDTLVPKEEALNSDSIDLDTADADTEPLFELGLPSAEALLDVSLSPVQIFAREEIITWADDKGGWEHTADDWLPTTKFRIKLNKRYRVSVPSYLLMAISSPDMAATATAFPVINTDAEWLQLAYIGVALEDAFKDLIGLTETGAETPYSDALTLLGQYIEDFHEEDSGAWATATWKAWGKIIANVSLPGHFDQVAISGTS